MNIFDFMIDGQSEETPKKEKPKKEPKKINVFNYIDQINKKTSLLEFDDKLCSGYMLTLHYSHERSYMLIVEAINRHLFYLSNRQVYDYFYEKIPKNTYFIRWPKKEKEEKDFKEAVDLLIEKYGISTREALESFI